MTIAEIPEFAFNGTLPQEYATNGGNTLTYISKGDEQIIYRLDTSSSRLPIALKINWHPLTRDISATKIIDTVESEYQLIRFWYKRIPGLIPPEIHKIIKLPSLDIYNQPATTLLTSQYPFITSPFSCLFTQLDEEQIIEKAKKHNNFGSDLLMFCRITCQNFRRGASPDIDGNGNLVVVDTKNGPYLRFIDPHNIFIGNRLKRMSKLHDRITLLERLSEKIK